MATITTKQAREVIDAEMFHDFLLRFYATDEFKHERLGQAFMNHFSIRPYAELFYEENQAEAMKLIVAILHP